MRRKWRGARWPRRRLDGERGSLALETAVLAPALIAVLGLLVAFGRVVEAGNDVDSAARAAARAASLERDADTAQVAAAEAARSSLSGDGVTCRSESVSVDTSGYSIDVGQEASVTATIVCAARLSDIALPGLPGSKQYTATWTSPLDTYRGRS
ncbi:MULTISPECIES: TadE/TadG family type IV pilus assembly protein [unclassified Streptomyces]|uniref:TadE/TadG family type IV pilus assembly protein n=1 Tax=unclassified Streptomyces TaxID=2593676 RepID=UPI000BC0AC30|nr:TadE/TadG family type IV pilus assembly protein [Streptomyces sp. CLI2509]ASY37096.1 hypothetical protein CAC01_30650 [Streptomyces sp. CLI2509]